MRAVHKTTRCVDHLRLAWQGHAVEAARCGLPRPRPVRVGLRPHPARRGPQEARLFGRGGLAGAPRLPEAKEELFGEHRRLRGLRLGSGLALALGLDVRALLHQGLRLGKRLLGAEAEGAPAGEAHLRRRRREAHARGVGPPLRRPVRLQDAARGARHRPGDHRTLGGSAHRREPRRVLHQGRGLRALQGHRCGRRADHPRRLRHRLRGGEHSEVRRGHRDARAAGGGRRGA
mmetsp:Transcript_128593/g.359847  ORF Transcript_128593/g.359847 Transcript_128593/m.359847 type:complete len:232 (-) Transcript_128593:179-874(-)